METFYQSLPDESTEICTSVHSKPLRDTTSADSLTENLDLAFVTPTSSDLVGGWDRTVAPHAMHIFTVIANCR